MRLRRAASSKASGPSARGFHAAAPRLPRAAAQPDPRLPVQAQIRGRLPASQGRDRQRREFHLRQRAFPRRHPRGTGRSQAPRLRVLADGRGPQAQPARHPRLPAVGLSAAGSGTASRRIPPIGSSPSCKSRASTTGWNSIGLPRPRTSRARTSTGSARTCVRRSTPADSRRSSSRPPTTTAALADFRRVGERPRARPADRRGGLSLRRRPRAVADRPDRAAATPRRRPNAPANRCGPARNGASPAANGATRARSTWPAS